MEAEPKFEHLIDHIRLSLKNDSPSAKQPETTTLTYKTQHILCLMLFSHTNEHFALLSKTLEPILEQPDSSFWLSTMAQLLTQLHPEKHTHNTEWFGNLYFSEHADR